ncbi:semaphorin-3D-like, partial [Cebidichthys violaceus]|uniref:semaphorin-3D-like n=1 Tax=Cebidichthys violaceus TaxID=271503 RepID=UPI0035CC153F
KPGVLSLSDLRNSSAVFWEGGISGGYQALLLDEDQGWLLVGGKDHIYLLRPDSLDLPTHTIHWPAAREHVEHCCLAGKSPETECANFVRLLQPFNKTHVYACGTGAFHPQCTYLHVGHNAEEPLFMLSHTVESGRGKCPFSPSQPFTARLTDGELYAGTSVDFMGANAAIFRTPVRGSSQHYIRTEAYDHNWLNEPDFVGSFSIPDTHSPDDDKLYFFFRERAAEAGHTDKRVYSRVARVCKKHLYVSSELGVVQLGLQRCELYGADCAECCLARDPYCSWDGQTCSRYFPTSKRRARRQDVKYGDPWSQCPITEDNPDSVEVKSVFSVEGNSTFLECVPRSPLAELRWTVQHSESQALSETQDGRQLRQSDDERSLHMKRGLLVQRLEPADSGLYTCASHEHSYSQVLARYRVHIIPNRSLHLQNLNPNQPAAPPVLGRTGPAGFLGQSGVGGHGNALLPQQPPLKSYKDLQLVGTNSLSVDEYCEQLWYREKRRQQKLRTLKLKQESRKARVRRNNPPVMPL